MDKSYSVLASGNSKIGKEHIQLNIEQLGTIKIYLDNYLDDTSQDSGRKAIIVEKRKERAERLFHPWIGPRFATKNYKNGTVNCAHSSHK